MMFENQGKLNRRTMLKGAAGSAAAAAIASVSKRSTVFAAPAVIQETGSKVKVTFWSSYGGTNGKVEQELLKRFHAANPDVEVNLQFQGTYEETAQKLTAALQAHQTPDFCVLSEANWFRFYTSQFLAPMDDMIKAAKLDVSDYVDSFWNEGNRNGKHWWMSFARSTPLFYYNADAFKEAGLPDRAPQTYDEFSKWGPELVKKSGGKVTRWGFSHAPSSDYIAWYFQGTIWAYGGHYSDDQFNIQITNPEGLAAGDWLRSTVEDGWAAPSQDRTTDFTNGATACIMQSTGTLGTIRQNAKFNVGTGFLPKEKQPGCPTGGSGIAILANAPKEKQEAAFKYITFVTSPEQTTFWSQKTGYMPVRKSAIKSQAMQDYYKKNPNFQTAVEQLPTTQFQDPARIYIPGGDKIIGDGLERITVNKAEVKSTFEDIANKLKEEAKPVIEKLKAIEG